MEEQNTHGGKRKGAGRKPKADELKAKELIQKALNQLYDTDNDEDATIEFIKEFAETPRGQQFVAEHLLGKPKEEIQNTLIMENIEPIKWVE